jgi:predicted dehydrogenase
VHLPLLRRLRGARLVAVADPSPAARRRVERIAGLAVGDDPAWLIRRSDVDAVVVCTPSAEHADVATAAAEAGRHVYLEKPIATNRADALRVVEAAASTDVVVAIGFNRRFHPLHGQARELLRAGAIGPVRSASSSFCEPIGDAQMPEWKRRRSTGGGVLLDLASHHADLLRWLLDDEAASVEASLVSERSEDDTARLRLHTSGGIVVHSFFSFRAARADWIRLVGDRGTIRIDRYGWAAELGGNGRPRWLLPAWHGGSWRLRKLVRPAHDPSWRSALAAFVDRVQGAPRELPTAIDGLRSLEIVLAAEASAYAATTAS